jgi:hypothetical protein
LESLESLNKEPKLVLINLQVGVTIGIEVRQRSIYIPRGVLVYKVDSRINHGDGPITAQSDLLSEGKSLDIDGWRISALVEGVDGMLVKIDKLNP